jgi:ADP-ribose pyrophosphatase YjhB (NUDIX family)
MSSVRPPHSHVEAIEYHFCPVCGGTFEVRTIKAGEPPRLVCGACGFVFYLDPQVVVGTIIETSDSRIVLVRRSIEPGYGKWVFPGGYVDRGERLETAAVREAKEESGLTIRIERLVNIYSYTGRTPVIVIYAARVEEGELEACDECLEAQAFAPVDIPWDDLAFRSTQEALREYLSQKIVV